MILNVIFLLVITASDLTRRKIPNSVTISAAVIGFICNIYFSGVNGLLHAGEGFALGFGLLILPFLLSGMGAGDVKAMAALGALIGPSAVFQTFLYMALIGGVISMVYYLAVYNVREKARAGLVALGAFVASRDVRCLVPATPAKKHKIPYAPAMALGYLAYLAWGNLV